MTRKRLRWITVQAVVVTVLAVVVVLTLLKPESNSPLSPIAGDGNPPTIAQGPGGTDTGGAGGNGSGGHSGQPGGHNGGRGGPGEGAGGHGHGGSGAPTGTATASIGGSPPIAPAPGSEASPTRPDGGSPAETPSEDQYADSLAAIDSALR